MESEAKTEFKKLKPKSDDLKVFNPATGLHLKNEGEEVAVDNYWRRRLKTGEVVAVEEKSNQVAGYDPGHQYPQVVDEQAGEKFEESKKAKK